MRIPLVPFVIFLAISLFSDVYIYRCLARRLKNRFWCRLQGWSALGFYLIVAVAVLIPRREGDNDMLLSVMWMLYTFLTVYFAKYLFVVIDLIGCIPQLFRYPRLKIVTRIAAVAAFGMFGVMWWAALINRYNIDVKHIEVERTNLPDAFDGYRIVQISDLHTGTYGNDTIFVSKLVDTINALGPDLIVFTGDIVNSRSSELSPHTTPLSRLSARDGILSILGNHDYGDYANWESPTAKAENLQSLKNMQRDMGWKMLNNSTTYLRRGADSIAVIGVENIGEPPFSVYGSLTKAYPTTDDRTFKVLLSHNPAHWRDSISNHESQRIDLTLSGHTHAMQMEVAGHSPAALRYREWGGLYADADSSHLLYVNIGAGTVGLPARIGATPEVTVLTLKKK